MSTHEAATSSILYFRRLQEPTLCRRTGPGRVLCCVPFNMLLNRCRAGGAQQNGSMAGQTPGPGPGSAAASLLRCAAQNMAAAAADLQRPRQPFKGFTAEAAAQLRLRVSSAAAS